MKQSQNHPFVAMWTAGFLAVMVIFWNLRGCEAIRNMASGSRPQIVKAQMGVAVTPMPGLEAPAPVPPGPEITPAPPRRRPRPRPQYIAVAEAPKTVIVQEQDQPLVLHNYLLLEGGVSFNSASLTPNIDNSCCRVGFVAGARFEMELDENLSLVPGVRYVQKGGRATIGGSQVEVALDYIEIPVHFKMRFEQGTLKPFLIGGASLAFLSSAQGRAYGATRDLRTRTESLDLSLDMGVGLEYQVDPAWSVYLANAYSLGLVDVDRSADAWRSRSFQFTGGLKYLLP